MKILSTFIIAVFLVSALPARAQFVINTSPGLFTPGFRDTTNNDPGNTTWWGWSSGSFDGTPDNELVDNPPVTLGAGGFDGSLSQSSSNDILSGSNNIYTSTFSGEVLNFGIPTNGTVGTGFTTIIIQGRTAFGGWNVSPGTFSDIAGVSPTLAFGNNAASQGQFWAKYELPGNAASYTTTLTMPTFTSIAEITVDTYWSATGYASDYAVVPEPSIATLAPLGISALLMAARHRKRQDPSCRR